jgi:hypothetical protein
MWFYCRLRYRVAPAHVATWVAVQTVATVGLVMLLIGSAKRVASADVLPTNVTYLKDIAPIFARRCLGCHASTGGLAMPLDTVERVRQWASSIRLTVLEKRMPPWPAAPGFNEFSNDKSLTLTETEVIRSWFDAGMPLGVPETSKPPSVQLAEATQQPALSLSLDTTSRDPAAEHRFVFRSRSNATRWMTGWALRPTSSAIREVRVLVDGENTGTLVLPETSLSFPRGVAQRVPPEASIAVELRYLENRPPDANSGTVDIFLGSRPSAELKHRALACGQTVFDHDVNVFALTPFVSSAAAVEIAARRPDRSVEPLLVIPKYNAAYRFRYMFRTPVRLPKGTLVDLRSSDPSCSADVDFSDFRVPRVP